MGFFQLPGLPADRDSTLPQVLLLHGIWNARAWVGPLAWRLRARGFQVQVFGYPSVFGGPDVAVPLLLYGGLMVYEATQGVPVETRTIALFVMGIPLFCACSGLARWHGEHMAAPVGERA